MMPLVIEHIVQTLCTYKLEPLVLDQEFESAESRSTLVSVFDQ